MRQSVHFQRLASHERVAEKFHMTMPTHYRRLRDVGHVRLTEMLRAREAEATTGALSQS